MSKKEGRGKLLTVFIIFWIFVYVLILYPSFINFPPGAYEFADTLLFKSQPLWYKQYFLISTIVEITSLVGMWILRKWAVYVYFGLIILNFIVSLDTLSTEVFIQSIVYSTLFTLPAYIIIRRKWHMFS